MHLHSRPRPIHAFLLPAVLFLAASVPNASGQTGSETWLQKVHREAMASKASYHPSVQRMADLIESNPLVRMDLDRMLEQVPSDRRVFEGDEDLLRTINLVISRAPRFDDGEAFPMSGVFVDLMSTDAGAALFRNVVFNDALREVLQAWCDFLDSPASKSVINRKTGWLSPAAWKANALDEFVIPDPSDPNGGFPSFNAYFHREIKPELRPIASPDDARVVVSANDGTVYKIARGVKRHDRFWIKSQPYSLADMLAESEHTDRFVGGDVIQTFLSGNDFHRFHAPISGTVVEARIIDGLMFSELRAMGPDPTGGTYSQAYEASVNTRGLLIIESPEESIGMVCVMPIGITEISSVKFTVEPGMVVSKGDEVGWFSYGGSSMCLIFEPDAVGRFLVPDVAPGTDFEDGPKVRVNAAIAEIGR